MIWAFGIKLTFYNLCDQQTSVHSVGAGELPAQLPAGYSYVMGLRVDVLTNGQILSNLPEGTGIEMDFPLHGQNGDTSRILYWNDEDGDGTGEWIELSELLSRNKITEALNTSTGDELYQIIRDKASVFYPVLTTDRTGIFILVRE